MPRAFLEGIARWAGEEFAKLAADPARREKAIARGRAFLANLVDGEKRQHAGINLDELANPPPSETPRKPPL